MKIEKFLKWIQFSLMNYPDISIKTVKIFIDEFYKCLSEVEQIRWILQYKIISELSLKQISIDSFIHNSKIDKLENNLNNLKESE